MAKSKYRIIVKAGPDRFVKYRSDNLLSFTNFLDKSYKGWRWFNVYSKDGEQLASFTNKHRPDSKQLVY